MNDICIDILMSTYNGEKYIKNQIFSLQQQTHTNWKLYIRDDGSRDNTVKIINKFLNDERIHIITDNLGNLGVAKSFFSLLKYSTSDWVIFCDQDDIWFEKKLEILLTEGKKNLDPTLPSLVYCDASLYDDKQGVVVRNSIQRLNALSLKEFLFLNSGYQGSSVLFNRKLADFAKEYKRDFFMHDDIISLIAFTFGNVYFVQKSLMLYRQHDKNVTGNLVLNKINIIKQFFNTTSPVLSKKHYLEKKEFFSAFSHKLPKYEKELYSAYLKYPECSFFQRIMIILKYDFSLGGLRIPLLLKSILRKPLL